MANTEWPDDDDGWRLEDEPVKLVEPQVKTEASPASLASTASLAPTAHLESLSHERLSRAVYVVTAEHLAWYAIALYALATRLLALGARPLDSAQATGAIAALALSKQGRAALGQAALHASWVPIAQAGVFATLATSDAYARIVVAMCGLILVASAFALRASIGRAGALALGAMLATSPSLTYYSRAGSTVIASMAFMMLAVAIVESMRRRPSVVRAAGLGCAIALWLSADPIGYASAVAMLAPLILVGVAHAIRIDHRRLRARVWWERRRVLVIVTTIFLTGVWLALTTALFTRPLLSVVGADLRAAFSPAPIALRHFVDRIVPIFAFYEFTIVILAVVGGAAIVSRRVSGVFPSWSLSWVLVGIAVFASIGANRADWVVAMLLPLAIVAACAVEWMHQSERWDSFPYALAALLLLTLYVGAIVNFAYPAPDTSEATWNRHALLFWAEPATSIQMRRECARAAKSVSAANATAFIPDDAPQARWYLRDFAPADSKKPPNIVVTVGSTKSGAQAGNPDSAEFGFEEWWTPDFRRLTFVSALRYFFTQRTWSDVEIRDLAIDTRRPDAAVGASSDTQ